MKSKVQIKTVYDSSNKKTRLYVYNNNNKGSIKMSNELPVKVYLENKICAELIATFQSEELYMLAVPALEAYAKENNLILTESIDDE